MRKTGIFRLLLIFIFCMTVILYNIGSFLSTTASIPENTADTVAVSSLSSGVTSTEAPAESTVASENKTETAQSTTVQAAAEAVKGKIISKYISPYTAPLSYKSIYMKNSTELSIDLKTIAEEKLGLSLNSGSEPQVLIMHTHTTESYMEKASDYYTADFKPRTDDNSKNMVRIGAIIAEKLNNAGIKTLHDTTQHDNPQYTGSYSRSAKNVTSYLQKYPSIKLVLDIHRDAVTSGESDKVKLVTEINGKKAAQVMLVMGSQSGTVTNHPNWRENLKLAARLQQKTEEKYPTLARPLLLMPKKYNQNLSTGSLLIEFGTDANSLAEACYSAELMGNTLAELFCELKE